jgi:hypothetical protein
MVAIRDAFSSLWILTYFKVKYHREFKIPLNGFNEKTERERERERQAKRKL